MKLDLKSAGLREFLKKYALVLLALAAGAALLLWPSGSSSGEKTLREAAQLGPDFDLEAMEKKISQILARIDGVGEVAVALTVKDGVEQIYAVDGKRSQKGDGWEEQTETVVISTGSGMEEVVPVQQRYPAFQGAVVVCEGGGSPELRLLITQAVSALTGLGADRISVCRGK